MQTLYKRDARGFRQTWKISPAETDGLWIIEWGYVNGLKQRKVKQLSELQASSLYAQKRNQGYSIDPLAMPPLRPMLAQTYRPGMKLNFPVYGQPKLDGVRAILEDGEFYSRNGKRFEHIKHLAFGYPRDFVFDGEIYVHGWSFQRIVSALKRRQMDTLSLHFHVFDVIITHLDFEDRLLTLRTDTVPGMPRPLTTRTLGNHDEIQEYLNSQIMNGFEGIMLRPRDGMYEPGKRSKHLLKYKPERIEKEFEIIGAKEDEDGGVVWICQHKSKEFSCRPMGSLAERQTLLQNCEHEFGKMLTVKFQNYTDEGLPRFPVGVAIRDYE